MRFPPLHGHHPQLGGGPLCHVVMPSPSVRPAAPAPRPCAPHPAGSRSQTCSHPSMHLPCRSRGNARQPPATPAAPPPLPAGARFRRQLLHPLFRRSDVCRWFASYASPNSPRSMAASISCTFTCAPSSFAVWIPWRFMSWLKNCPSKCLAVFTRSSSVVTCHSQPHAIAAEVFSASSSMPSGDVACSLRTVSYSRVSSICVIFAPFRFAHTSASGL